MRNLLLAFGLTLNLALAADKPTADSTAAAAPATSPKRPIYKPPMRGAPAVRVDGGSRGSEGEMPVLLVLAPDHTGFTTAAQPALYWFQSKPTTAKLEFTLIADNATAPLLETTLDSAFPDKYRGLKLAERKISLAEGTEYQWSVAIVPDPDNRSKDIIASGRIQRVPVPSELSAALAQVPANEKYLAYAQAGMWYDAIEALQNLLEKNKDNPTLLGQRAELLSQVGLMKAIDQAAKGR